MGARGRKSAAPPDGEMKVSLSSVVSPLPKRRTAEKIGLLLLPLCLLVLIGAVNFPNEFHLRAQLASLHASAFALVSGAINGTSSPPAPPPEFRLLIGVLTVADRYEARARLRLLRDLQPPVAAHIDLRFVLCNVTWEPHRVLVALEIMRFNDIIVLNCSENMNSGKTYAFLSSLPGLFNGTGAGRDDKPFDFVMKTDDDAYIRYPGLVASLRNQTRDDLYWGHHVPAAKDGSTPLFMAGMGYVLSWDLVEWIAASDVPRNRTVGPEDALVGVWLHDGGRGKNVHSTRAPRYNVDTQPVSYDLPVPGTGYTFVPDTVLVHRLKGPEKWAQALSYFNVTAALKKSRFHNLGRRRRS